MHEKKCGAAVGIVRPNKRTIIPIQYISSFLLPYSVALRQEA